MCSKRIAYQNFAIGRDETQDHFSKGADIEVMETNGTMNGFVVGVKYMDVHQIIGQRIRPLLRKEKHES